MAEMIPAYLPDHASQGEKAVFAALQELPDDVLVYYEPLIRRRYPDFIIIDPEAGVLVIEVKGWRAGWIKTASLEDIVIQQAGHERTERHPLRQARDYQNRLMRLCQAHPYGARLLNGDASHPRFGFRFGHLAVLTGASRNDLAKHQLQNLFPIESTVCTDEWQELKAASPASLRARLIAAFDPGLPRRSLSPAQVSLLRAIIHPVDLPTRPADLSSPDPSPDLRVLDFEQERAARDMRPGHRVLYGVAGSGKTVILIARAKLIAEDEPRSILLLCFNRPLANHFRQVVAPQSNITVNTFGEWASCQGARANDDAEEFGLGLLQILRQGGGQSGQFDAVLVDEGQDFVGSWFKCCVEALRDQIHGDLVIAYDLSQNLYKRPPVTWSQHGIHIKGGADGSRTTRLTINYRNTFEILTAAASFAQVAASEDEDIPGLVPVDVSMCRRRGPWPLLRRRNGQTAQIHACKDFVHELLGDGLTVPNGVVKAKREEIRVLYPRNQHGLLDELHSVFSKAGLGDIAITTIHASKGLQAKVVILVCADMLPSDFADRDPAAERAQFYVALTRAEELLIVLSSGDTPFLKELDRNIEFGLEPFTASP